MDAACLGRLRAGPCHFSGGVKMASSHTHGPWRTKRWTSKESGIVATIDGKESDICGYALNANARLIAAAPELLAALIALAPILATAESNASGNPEWEAVSAKINAARAAIAKATGK